MGSKSRWQDLNFFASSVSSTGAELRACILAPWCADTAAWIRAGSTEAAGSTVDLPPTGSLQHHCVRDATSE
ncbi:cdd, partial [Ophiophagus hannah]